MTDETDKYWYLRCKVCSHFHRGERVPAGTYIVPSDAEFSCPGNPGKSAAYQQRDWVQMTTAQWQEEERKMSGCRQD